MKTYVGIWDAIFGKWTKIELPMPDGTTKTVEVTEKWMERMQQQGLMKRVDHIDAHVIEKIANPKPGEPEFTMTLRHWVIGQDVPKETCENMKDKETGCLYAFIIPEDDGGKKIMAVPKNFWMSSRKKNFGH